MPDPFIRTFHVGWGHLDSNSHMANTAYLDVCVDVRFMYFAFQGFSPKDFERLRFGPVVQRDEIDYFRELRLLEPSQGGWLNLERTWGSAGFASESWSAWA